jgi:N-acyl-D-aspartate/D-glutamate deacylase
VIRVFVRERAVVSLPAAIHAMTGRTAARYRVPDRGVVRVGAAADLVVFDPTTIADTATWEEPRRAPIGISNVLVDGQVVVTNGHARATRPGRVLAVATVE